MVHRVPHQGVAAVDDQGETGDGDPDNEEEGYGDDQLGGQRAIDALQEIFHCRIPGYGPLADCGILSF